MPGDAANAAITPRQIRQKGPRELVIVWGDGYESQYDVRDLRLACACAQCVNEWTGESHLHPSSVPLDVHPLKIEGVGRYAIPPAQKRSSLRTPIHSRSRYSPSTSIP
jgi:ATP-binding protein involved in chromosome partitioning